ncbi:MAG: hypothetical protein ACKOEO_05975, partial [Planctomycetaceae bacterium]
LAALADGFTSITIGHNHPGNSMRLGDACSMFTVKATGLPRVVDAAIKDPTTLLAQAFTVEGDFRAPNLPLTLQGRTLEVTRTNLHTPTNATPDSGLSAFALDLEITEQVLVTGWLRADSSLNIETTATTGENPLQSFPNEANSFKGDVGADVRTLLPGSQLTITASGSVLVAATLQALGTGSQLSVTAGTRFQLDQGGILRTPGADSQLQINGGQSFIAKSGSAILAGVEFQQQDGRPVPYSTGSSSSITLTATGEMWLAGSVSSTGTMSLNAGSKGSDYASYFDTLPGTVLATATPAADVVAALQSDTFPEALRDTFNSAALPLGDSVTLTELETDRRWLAVDSQSHRYVLYLTDPNNDGTLDALQIMQPHDLIGQRGFSFLVTGTMTVLEDNRSLTLQAVDDVIIRGNLNLPGDGSDLVLQSDKWVYWEGAGTIGGDLTIAGGLELDG